MHRFSLAVLAVLAVSLAGVTSFQTPFQNAGVQSSSSLMAHNANNSFGEALGKSAAVAFTAFVLSTTPVHADEYGRETEAPTLYTGETEMVSHCHVLGCFVVDICSRARGTHSFSCL